MGLSIAPEARFVPGASARSRLLGLGLRTTLRPLLDLWGRLPIDVYPPELLDRAVGLLPLPGGTEVERIDLPWCPAEIIRARDVDPIGEQRAILYLHGGAFLSCGLGTHRRLTARISAAADQPVLSVGYRQMPRESVTSSIADGLSGLQHLIDQGHAPEDITIVGDSAGGYLAFAVARAALDAGLGRAAGVVALSPLLGFELPGRDQHRNARSCPTFTLRAFDRLNVITAKIEGRLGTAGLRVDPVDMPLEDFPPTLIQVGSTEILLGDAEAMAARLVAAGVPCDLQIWDRQVHVFQAAASWVPEARSALAEMGEFISELAEQPEGAGEQRAAAAATS